MKRRKPTFLSVFGLLVFAGFLLTGCSGIAPIGVTIYPNLAEARSEGFHLLSGHPPFAANFRAAAHGGDGALTYAWDFDGDGTVDSRARDPEPFEYARPGVYAATVTVGDERAERAQAQRRVVVIGGPDRPGWRYGVTAHLNRARGLYASDAEVERAARMISAAGIEAVRLDLSWATVQRQNGDQYEWGDYDYLVELSRRQGFELLPVIGFSPGWASAGREDPNWANRLFAPPSPTDYAWFAYKSAARYKSDINAWEVWNEPNSAEFWRPRPNPALYAQLLRNAYLAIKYADPGAVVVMGGLASAGGPRMAPEAFLQAVYDEGGGPYFDAVGSHLYAYSLQEIGELVRQLNSLRTVVVANGDGEKPLWLTEFGTSAATTAKMTDETQGMWLAQSLNAFSGLDHVPVVLWYNFREKGVDPGNYQQNYGLIERDWTVKPAYSAYAAHITDDRAPRQIHGAFASREEMV